MRAALISLICLLSVAARAVEIVQDCPTCPEMVGIAPDLAIGRFDVTFDEWQACVDARACRGGKDDHGWGRGRRPVINITFADAQAFTGWLSSATGKNYDLPTEAEWEMAAKAGTTTAYWWGDDIGSGHANCRECGSPWGGKGSAPVGSFPPNPWGLYDMNGNVWQWTKSCWAEDCRDRVIRGGSWYYYPAMSKATARARGEANQWSYNIGLRVVRRP